jgi:hypothetical protein
VDSSSSTPLDTTVTHMKSKRISRAVFRLVVAVLLTALSGSATAQVENSGAQTIVLTATVPESLTLSLSASALTFSLTAGAARNPGNVTITATTAWVLKRGRPNVALYAYFTNAAAALTDGAGNNIPSSAFGISDNGQPYRLLRRTVQFSGARAGRQLAIVAITDANRSGNRTDVMAFNIDLSTGTLPQLPAAVYTGTLNIQAQASP